jgi:hypothetical protein
MDIDFVTREEFIEEVEKLQDPGVPLEKIEIEDKAYLGQLMQNIQERGLSEPLLVLVRRDGSKILWDGHHRLIVLKRLGWKKVPITFMSEKAYMKQSLGGSYDYAD